MLMILVTMLLAQLFQWTELWHCTAADGSERFSTAPVPLSDERCAPFRLQAGSFQKKPWHDGELRAGVPSRQIARESVASQRANTLTSESAPSTTVMMPTE